MAAQSAHAGPIIREWQAHRAMPAGVKPWADLLLTLSFGTSILTMSSHWHQLILAALWLILAWLLWRVPVRRTESPCAELPRFDN